VYLLLSLWILVCLVKCSLFANALLHISQMCDLLLLMGVLGAATTAAPGTSFLMTAVAWLRASPGSPLTEGPGDG